MCYLLRALNLDRSKKPLRESKTIRGPGTPLVSVATKKSALFSRAFFSQAVRSVGCVGLLEEREDVFASSTRVGGI